MVNISSSDRGSPSPSPMGKYNELKKQLSYSNYCPDGFLIDSVEAAENRGIRLLADYDSVSKLPGAQRQQLLMTLVWQALDPDAFYESIEFRNIKGQAVSEELKSKLFLRDLHQIFNGQTPLEDFISACEVRYTDLLAECVESPVFFDAFEGILPSSFYTQKGVQFLIRDHVLCTAEQFPLLLPVFSMLPGFKECFRDLNPSEAERRDFKSQFFARIKEPHYSTAVLISEALDLLQIGELVESRSFIELVDRQIRISLEKKSVADASNWLCLLPRDPENAMKFRPEAQEVVAGHEEAVLELVLDALEDEDLHSDDLTPVSNVIRNFISKQNRSESNYYYLIRSAVLRVLEDDGQLDKLKKLVRTLSISDQDALLRDAEVRAMVEEVVRSDERKFNQEMAGLSEKPIEVKSRFVSCYKGFVKAANFFIAPPKNLFPLPPQIEKELSCYHYIADICSENTAAGFTVRPDMHFVNKHSWKLLARRAQELFAEGRMAKSEIYAQRALNCMIAVPGISREPLIIAGLFNLRSKLESSAAQRTAWAEKERLLLAKTNLVGAGAPGS